VNAPKGHLETAGIDRYETVADALGSGLRQQSLNDRFRLFVGALAEISMPSTALRIDQIQRGSISVVEGPPNDRLTDRIIDLHRFPGSAPALCLDIWRPRHGCTAARAAS
jgi:hypothetical protein